MSSWIPTGCFSIDRFLEGGLQPGRITLVYGEAETGKTSLAIQCAVNSARMGYKTLFIDSDGTFSLERLSQIASEDFEEISDLIILAKPSSFNEQAEIIDNLDKYVSKTVGLIAFDTITSLYRSELRDKEENFRLNRELNRQVATLAQMAKTLEAPILLTSQVRSLLAVNETRVEPVATRVIRFWSDVVIRLARTGKQNLVRATIEKSNGKERRLTFCLVIAKDGIHDYHQ